jgi:hypothetical protein
MKIIKNQQGTPKKCVLGMDTTFCHLWSKNSSFRLAPTNTIYIHFALTKNTCMHFGYLARAP